MTPREALKKATLMLRGANVPDPEVDSALLLSHLTGKQPLMLRLDMTTQLSEDTLCAFEKLLARRMEREPLQYLTGETVFLGQVFHVDGRVLIPRPETELLAERAMHAIRGFNTPVRVLDLCCGSGCIGLTLAGISGVQATLCDLSQGALEVARSNAERLHVEAEFRQGDLFAPVQGERFHVIVSNPPYIPQEECKTLQEEVRKEPLMALDGGEDGLDFYRRIAAQALEQLQPDGVLLLEAGWNQAQEITQMLRAAGMAQVDSYPDMQGIQRMVEAHAPGGDRP
mgnify:FL=1